MGGASYAYDGDGDRVSRTVGGTLTHYLLDKQSPLTLVLSETTSGATTRYLHGPTGIFGQQNNTQATTWGTNYMLQDGLGSVRVISDGPDILSAQAYSPYGEPLQSALPTDFGFTGEQTDPLNDLVYLRARYLNPRLGVFGSRDPFAGNSEIPLSLNRYGWVQGNAANLSDASGLSPFATLIPRMVTTILWAVSNFVYYSRVQQPQFNVSSTVTITPTMVMSTDTPSPTTTPHNSTPTPTPPVTNTPDPTVTSVPTASPTADYEAIQATAIAWWEAQRVEARRYVDAVHECLTTTTCNTALLGEKPDSVVDGLALIYERMGERSHLTTPMITDLISYVITGASGRSTLFDAWRYGENHPINTLGSGFAPDIYQSSSQPSHLFAHMNTVMQGGGLVQLAGDIWHECIDDTGAFVDAKLYTHAIYLGNIGSSMTPGEFADEFRETLSANNPRILAPHYYLFPLCWDLK